MRILTTVLLLVIALAGQATAQTLGTPKVDDVTVNSLTPQSLKTWLSYLAGTANPNEMNITPANPVAADSPALNLIRVTTFSGGTPGYTNTALRVYTQVAAAETAYEWNLLAQINNYAAAGSNLAGAFIANKYSTGETWSLLQQVNDYNNAVSSTAGSMVATETDISTSHLDDYSNGLRVGYDMIIEQATATTAAAEVGYGFRVNVATSGPNGPAQVRRAFSVLGTFNQAAFDTSLGTAGSRSSVTAAAFRSAAGQIWDFSGTSTYYWWLNNAGNVMQYVASGAAVLSLTGAGALSVSGTITGDSFSGAYATVAPTATLSGYTVTGTAGAYGLDTHSATLSNAAILMSAGQTIALEATQAVTLSYNTGSGSIVSSYPFTVNGLLVSTRLSTTGDTNINAGSALSLAATTGFVALPYTSGIPTGAPTQQTNCAIDTTNSYLNCYWSGAWHKIAFSAGAG